MLPARALMPKKKHNIARHAGRRAQAVDTAHCRRTEVESNHQRLQESTLHTPAVLEAACGHHGRVYWCCKRSVYHTSLLIPYQRRRKSIDHVVPTEIVRDPQFVSNIKWCPQYFMPRALRCRPCEENQKHMRCLACAW